MDLLKAIFILTVLVAFPLGEISRISLINSVYINFLDIGVFIMSAFWFFRLIRRKIQVDKKLLKFVSLFILIALLSLLVNFKNLKFPEFLVSSLYLVRWIFYATIPFVVTSFEEKFKNKIPLLMITAGIIVLVMGFIQYLFYPDLRNLRYAGWDEHLYRFFSWSFFDPNFAGSFLVIYLLFILNKIYKNGDRYILKLSFLVFLVFISILLTFSRAAFIELFIGVLVLSILKNKKTFMLGFIFLSIISILILLRFPLKSEGTNILRTASSLARLDSLNRAVTIFRDSPVLGMGFDSYRYAQKKYGFIDKNWDQLHSGAGTDNSFVFVLATTGVIGFLAYIYMWFNLLKYSNSSIFIASTIAVFVNSLFVNSLFYTFIMFWLWIIWGIRKNT